MLLLMNELNSSTLEQLVSVFLLRGRISHLRCLLVMIELFCIDAGQALLTACSHLIVRTYEIM